MYFAIDQSSLTPLVHVCVNYRNGRKATLLHFYSQFSWWCDGRSDDATEEEPYSHAKEIARKALNHQLKDRTGGALYFHNRKVTPSWSRAYIKTVDIGELVFYKPAGGEAK